MDAFFIFSAKYSFVLALSILGVYFLTRRWPAQKRMALFAIPAGLLTYLLGLIANHLYYDPRPFVVDHFTPLIQHIADNGFPSDDTLLVAALAAVGMYWNKWLGTILWALTFEGLGYLPLKIVPHYKDEYVRKLDGIDSSLETLLLPEYQYKVFEV